jgi:phosphoglycolate phosphatase
MVLLFDLDGTLTDPAVGITRCLAYALNRLGYPPAEQSALLSCIGPPMQENFAKLLQTQDQALISSGIALYRERFSEVGLLENEIIPGLLEVVQTLHKSGHRLIVCTSKPWVYAEKIIAHFGYAPYFDKIYGSELDGSRGNKAELIAYILACDNLNPADCTMIGDRKHDILGAKANLMPSVGVLWGYGDAAELNAAGADWLVEAPKQLLSLLNKNS